MYNMYAYSMYVCTTVHIDLYLHLLQKIRESKIGTICNDFDKLDNLEIIGKGAFGVVYLCTTCTIYKEKLAIKKENKVRSYVPMYVICTMLKYVYFCVDSLSLVIQLCLKR